LASGTATDTLGNKALAAGPSGGFVVSNTGLSVTISPPSAATTSSGPVNYFVTYNSPNFDASTLSPADITLNATETANGSVGVSGSGNTRTVTISSITGKGTLGISIAANTATDLSGHHAPAAGPSAAFTVNHPPVVGTVNIQRGTAASAKVKVADLLASASDADGDTLTLTAVQSPSPGGATVQIKGAWVFYSPPASLTVGDTFTFAVSDTRGGSANGTVVVSIAGDDAASQNILSIENLGGGQIRIRFAGVPGRTYTVQSAPSTTGPWKDVGTASADATGVAIFLHTPGAVTTFYRTVYP
jgi:hypothetical protein